jgi:WD40-like Beta Propeller Repeat
MLRVLFIAALVLLASRPSEAPAQPAAPPRINCPDPYPVTADLMPAGASPLVLAQIYCLKLRQTYFPTSAPMISPDGQSIAYYEHDTILRVGRLDGRGGWTDYQADLGVFATFELDKYRAARAVAWASHSRFLWTATHERERPLGFAVTAMRPVHTLEGGGLQPLPPLQYGAGPLDALLWAGGDGLAVAQFGTRGGYYRPEHQDPAPTFAIVDAARGLVLDSLLFDAIAPLRLRGPGTPPRVLVRNAAATVLPDGKVRVLLSVGQWVVWTQGEAPRVLPDPYGGDQLSRIALSPDGARVLVGRLLRTEGGMCIRLTGCTPGRPVEGILVALYDVESGRALWSIRATATNDYEFPTPAISPDGRYALVGLMPQGDRPQIGLLAMTDGAIVQTLPAPAGSYTMGFARGGRTVWTQGYGVAALYDF